MASEFFVTKKSQTEVPILDNNESKSEEKIPKHFEWKSPAGFAAVATIVISIITVLSYFGSSSTSTTQIVPFMDKTVLVAEARYRRIELPSSYEDALRTTGFASKISSDKKIKTLLQKLPKESRDDVVEAISYYISTHIPYHLVGRSDFLKGWWYVDIENVSDETIYDVVLEIPGYIVVTEVFRNSTGLIEIDENKDYLKLGDLRPRERVTISAWSADRLPSFTYEKFVLTHKNGVGEVQIK